MLATTIWFLFITQSFAKDLTPHAHQQVFNENVDSETPIMDYFDGINWPNPHYKINYIYEQIKTDEDPEIEEKIEKYMLYQPSTATTTTELQQRVEDVHENFKEITNYGPFETPIIVLETHDNKYEKKEVTSTLAPMPPAPKLRKSIHPRFPTALPATAGVRSPPIIQWEELKEVPNNDVTGFHLDRPYFPARVSAPHRHPKCRLHISPTTSSEAPVEVEAQTNYASTEKYIHLSPTVQNPSFQSQYGHDTFAKVRPTLDDIKQGSIALAPRSVHRGSYKFSLDDINDMHTSTATPKESQLKENPIPPVPTLSPWYDGYGK